MPFNGPNDLVFGPDGRLYITDPGTYRPGDPEPSRLFVMEPDGTGRLLAELSPPTFPNGIAVEADGNVVWAEQGAPRPTGPYIAMRLTNIRPRGRDWTEALKDGAGNVTMRLQLPGEWTAWACDLSGHRVREIPLLRDGDDLVLTSDQATGTEPVLVYDLKCVGSEAYLKLATEVIQREREIAAAS